jgi:lysine-arginine-ornithine-binding protein
MACCLLRRVRPSAGLGEMSNREMAVKIAHALLLIGLGSALAAGPAAAKDWKTVRIGMDATYPPFESVDPSGKIVGFEVDYTQALCAKMHVTCTFQNQDWDGIIPALLAGKFDVIISSMNETPARAKKVMFSDVYYATSPVWVAQVGNKSDDVSPDALKGKLIGTQSSTVFANFLDKHFKGSEVKLYPGGDEALLDLANGRLDYAVDDILVSQKFLEKNPNCCRIVAEIARSSDPEVFGPGVGAAFRPDDKDLVAMFNKAIKEAATDGTFKKLEAPYFKVDISPKM